MKICRYKLPGAPASEARIGVLLDGALRDVTAVADDLPSVRWPLPAGDLLIANLDRLRPRMVSLAAAAEPIAPEGVHFLAPVANPSKIICGLANWPHHMARSGISPLEKGLLNKATDALAGPGDGVIMRRAEPATDHEIELAFIIGREGTNISPEDALGYVAGYAIGLDMTLQGPQNPGHRKCVDGYAVIGPWMTTADEVPDPARISYRFFVNGQLEQERCYGDLLLGVAELISFASANMTLHPGDVFMSGTPEFKPVKHGDVLSADFDILGSMETKVYLADQIA